MHRAARTTCADAPTQGSTPKPGTSTRFPDAMAHLEGAPAPCCVINGHIAG